ncbi:hypothetical protein QWY85_07685 [Neolewinella lacunae]|uniref:Uncharacterized protein n=1 Tax=Neolewinella lacunae TaxID=1517758 RepID=A0A923T7M0_9BACT|nr:hypothetical protein [Neolewinella lacunae]MBC6994660.1 hypothetical protein [Neolewinella lacunae]MDN3634532.1 hypothetical protein [Neolewinella lacunae]
MPGKQQEDWTDDAAFWDEAWRDMQQRLDAPAQRRAAAWWYRPALLAVLFLVVASLVLLAYRAGREHAPATPTPPQPAVAATTKSVATPPATPAPLESPETTTPSPTLVPEKQSTPARNAPPEARPISPNSRVALGGPASSSPGTPSTAPRAVEGAALENTLPPPTWPTATGSPLPEQRATERVLPTAVSLLPSLAQLLPFEVAPATSRKAVEFRPTRRPGSFAFEWGAIATPSLQKPGFTAGLAYRLPARGRLEFPLQLRYRQEKVQIVSANVNGLTGNLENLGTGAPMFNAQSVESLFLDLQRARLDALRTRGLELVVGADYRLNSRWTFGVAGGLEYLLQAQGPIIFTDTLSNQAVFRSAGFEDLLVVDFAAADQSPVSGGTPVFNAGRNASAVGSINRLVPRAYLRAGYQVAPRLGLYASGSYLLGTVYQDGLGSLRREQVKLGLRWRIN